MNDWREVTLAEVASEVTVGHVGSMAKHYIEDGIPFLRSLNVNPHCVNLRDVKYISPEFHAKLGKSSLLPGDVVTVRTGKPGTTSVIPEELPIANCSDLVITRPGPDLDAWWFSYYMNSIASNFIESQLVGAVQQHFNVGSAKSMKINLPPLAYQEAVVEVLGALDDKITANTKLAKTSDKLADSLFRQALISATYSDETFADIAKVSGGGTPSTKKPEYWDGEVPWATPTDVTALSGPYLEKTSRTISEAGLNACSSELYPAGSILMTSRATIGAFALAQVLTAVNQGFIVVQPNDPSLRFWLFHEMRSRVDEFISLANGATFLELSRGNFKKFQVRKAAPETMAAFNETAAALHNSARAALLENHSLAATRDALLPQLMSGKLQVKDAEKVLESTL